MATTIPLLNSWRWLVCALNGHGLTNLDRIATNQALTYVLDDSYQFTCDVPSDNPSVYQKAADGTARVAQGRRILYGFRREETHGGSPWKCRFSGILTIAQDQATSDEPVTHLTANDAWTWAKALPVLTPGGYLLPEKGYTYENKRGDQIALDVIANAYTWIQAQWAFGSPLRYTWPADFNDLVNVLLIDIAGGQFDHTDVIPSFPIQQGASVADVWTQLSQTGGLDIVLDPVYAPREAPGRIARLNVYNQAGSDRTGAIFGWDMFPRNLVGVDHLLDATQLENWAQFYAGGFVAPHAVSEDSVSRFGPYVVQKNITQGNVAAVSLLALAEVALRKRGKQTLAIDPAPAGAGRPLAPDPFTHYYLGDTVYVYAGRHLRPVTKVPDGFDPYGIALRQGIRSPQSGSPPQSPWRVYGFEINLADDQTETVQNLLLTDPNPGTV